MEKKQRHAVKREVLCRKVRHRGQDIDSPEKMPAPRSGPTRNINREGAVAEGGD